MNEPSTPLMRQYAAVKKEHPTALLFFRLGDFYELFFDDAVVAAKELQITLTSRNKEKGMAVPMCGVPYHAAEGYIGKLIRKGFKVAICEQMEDARLAKKLVRREVTRVVTPGTAADSSLGSEENNFLAALAQVGDRVGFAALDLSTGEFRATEFSGESAMRRVQEELEQLRAKELLYGSTAPLFESTAATAELRSGGQPGTAVPTRVWLDLTETPLDDWIFAPDHALPLLENHFGVLSLEGFGLAGRTAAACAAGAILYYVRSTQRGSLDHVDRIGWYERQNCLVLDAVTVRNLELIEPLFAGTDPGVTLFRCIDSAVTPMGKRLLRAWLLRPSLDMGEIDGAAGCGGGRSQGHRRPRRIAESIGRRARSGALAQPGDAGSSESAGRARAGGIAGEDSGNPERGATASVRRGCWFCLGLWMNWATCGSASRRRLFRSRRSAFADGGVIAPGLDRELDELRELSRNSKAVLAQIEQRERERTGISSLKVKFNSIFGYYIEDIQVESASGPAGLRPQADAGRSGALHHAGIEGVRGQNSRCAGKDRRHRAPAIH